MSAQLMAVHSLATQLRREIHEIKLAQVADRAAMQRCFGIVNTGLRRIGMAPAFRVVQGVGGVGAGMMTTTYLLWQVYKTLQEQLMQV